MKLKKIIIIIVAMVVVLLFIAMLSENNKKPPVKPTPTPTTTPTTIPEVPLGKFPNCDIVFTSDKHQVGIGEQGSELYCINSDGSNLQRITNNDYFEFHADVSPKRQEIVTVTHFTEGKDTSGELDSNSELVLWGFDGKMIKQLTTNSRAESVPHWSPNGELITFFAGNSIGKLNIYTIDRNGNENKLTSGGVDVDPSFSPNNEIIFSRGKKIMIMNSDGSNLKTLIELEITPEDPIFIDSDTITFESEKSGLYNIYTIKKDGTNLKQITDNIYHGAMPQPIGNKLTYWTIGDEPAGTGIWIMDKDGNNQKRLISEITNSQMPTGNQ